MNILPFDKQIAAIAALTEGCSIRATERTRGQLHALRAVRSDLAGKSSEDIRLATYVVVLTRDTEGIVE